jgi:predicted Zn-dependent peptidase
MNHSIHHLAGTGALSVSLQRRTLGNGLRVVLAPRWRSLRAAVSVHYGAGFRSERAGQEGLAHLFEHLMFRGSESLPDATFFDDIHALGGTANGTTHQDYTDYVQVLPAAALEQALFREADRMRAPRFTEEQLAIQLSGVAQEIAAARDERPYGGCPWPLLPRALFRDFSHTHDGYGDMERLRRTTVEDCAAFFDEHYSPANAVLTVVGPHAPDDVWPLIERHFGDIPGRRTAPTPPVQEPPPTEDTWLTCTEPGVNRTAVAVGYRLPNPATELPDYLAHMVVAELLSRPGGYDGPGLPASTNASCGFFGPLDALDPDALIVASVLPPDLAPENFRRALTDWAAGHSVPQAITGRARRAATLLGARHRRTHADIQERCLELGRLELLFGRAELADEIPELLETISAEAVAAAAAALASAAAGVLVLEPGSQRTRPAKPDPGPPPVQRGPAVHRSAGELGRSPLGRRPLPPLGRQPEAILDGARESRLGNGLCLIAVPDTRSRTVELRLRVPLGPVGWSRPRAVERLLRTVEHTVQPGARAARLGGELQLTTDGQWADVTGWAPTAARTQLLGLVAELLDAGRVCGGFATPAERSPGPSPEQRMDEELRLHWTRGRVHDRGEDSPVALHRSVFAPRGALLVLVSDVDPACLMEEAAGALGAWTAPEALAADPPESTPRAVHVLGLEPVFGAAQVFGPGAASLPAADAPVHVTLSYREATRLSLEPARYLTTALFGSRLAQWGQKYANAVSHLSVGRDTVAGHPRSVIRLSVPRASLTHVVAGMGAEMARLASERPAPPDVATTVRYCAAQLLSAYDSPATLADALRHTLVPGRELDWVMRRPHLLRAVNGESVMAAAHDLYLASEVTAVALTPRETTGVEDELARALAADPRGLRALGRGDSRIERMGE